jgi:hypothetical protein
MEKGKTKNKNKTQKHTHLYESGPGVSASTMPAAAIAPVNCATQYKPKRTGPMTPTRRSARLTSGLNRPPVARKKNQAETSRLSPNAVAMYRARSSADPSTSCDACVPPNASSRNTVVPTNSNRAALKSLTGAVWGQ